MFPYVSRAIFSMITILFTILTFFACGETQTELPAEAIVTDVPRGEEPVTISILQSQASISQSLQRAVDLYADSQSEAPRISVQTIADPSDYKVTLRARLLAGEQVDLFHVLGYRDMLELRPYLTDLSDLDWLDQAVEGSLDAVTYEDAVYGVPYSIQGVGLIANRNIFEVAGIPLAGTQSYADLEEAFSQLDRQIQSGALEDQFPALEAVTELSGLDKTYLGTQFAALTLSGDFLSPAQAAQASSLSLSAADGAREYFDLLERYAAGDPAATARNQQVENGLAIQRVAVIQDDISVWETANKLNPGLGNRLALLPIPLGEEGESGILLEVPAYWAVNQSSTPQAQQLSTGFLAWLYNSGNGAEAYSALFYQVSPFQAAAPDSVIPLQNQMLGYLESGQVLYQYSAEYPPGWGSDVFAPGLLGYLVGEKTWQEATEEWSTGWHTLR